MQMDQYMQLHADETVAHHSLSFLTSFFQPISLIIILTDVA